MSLIHRLCAPLAILLLSLPAQADSCTPLGWGRFISPGPQDYEVVERIDLGEERLVIGVRFGAPTGNYAKLALFMLVEGECDLAVISQGSYALTNMAGEEPVFHLDLYEPDSHSTLEMMRSPLSYEQVRDRAVAHFTGGGE